MLCDSLSATELQHRKFLRKTLRQRRRALTPHQQQRASRVLAHTLKKLPPLKSARHIAAYVASDGEINPALFLRWAQRQGKTIWLPVICDKHPLGMRFMAAPRPAVRGGWRRNRHGIPEPRTRHQISPRKLDVLLMPLVGFDAQGNRLGMGGGYYDRLLQSLAHLPRKPRCLGLAHRCQQVPALVNAAWDRPVDTVIAV